MLPFPALDPAAIPAEKDAVSRCYNFGSSVPFGLLQSNFAAQGLSRVSIWSTLLTSFTAAVRMLNVPNASSSSRDLVLAALCFMRAAFLSARFPRRLFRANALRLWFSSVSRCFLPRFLPSFFRRVGCGAPTTPRLLHSRHFCLLVCALRAFLLSSLRVPRFPRRRSPNFPTVGTVAAPNDFALLECITASRCCWQACTVSIDEFAHQSMSYI